MAKPRIKGAEQIEADPEPVSELKSFPVPEAGYCPHCHGEQVSGSKVGDSKYQVQCHECGLCGPFGRSLKNAVSNWNSIPRGRPEIYETIRTRALHLISEGLGVYEQALDSHKLTDHDCLAIAKMLEAATMAVDTWEL